MKKYIFLLLISVSIFSCKKSDNSTGNNPPIETKITYTIDSISTQPGLFATLKASGLITKDTCTVQLAGKPTLLTQIDSLHYVFFVPVLSPGTYILDLKNLNAGNNPEVVIRNYTAISNPDNVITAVMKTYNDLADSLVKNSINNAVTSSDATFMHQLMDQLSKNIQLCSVEEKLSLAYQFQNMNLDNTFAKKTDLDTAHLAFRLTEQKDDAGYQLIFYVIDGVKANRNAIISAGAAAIAFTVASKTPNVFTIPVFIGSIANLYVQTKSASKANEEIFNFTGTALDPVTEVNGNGTTTNPIVVSTGKIVWENFQTSYRTLFKADETSSNKDISDLIKIVYELVKTDATIKSLFDNFKSKFNSYFDKITGSYSTYVSPVLATAKQKVAKIKNEFVLVSNISDPAITITAADDGKNGLKLTFDNPSKNITKETNFTFQMTYTQTAINNKVSITQQAKFLPLTAPSITTTIPGSVTSNSAALGGIITNDGGNAILDKGVTYSPNSNLVPSTTVSAGTGNNTFLSTVTGLTASTTYYVRAYATNSAGTAYGNVIAFTTGSGALSLNNTIWEGYYYSSQYPPGQKILAYLKLNVNNNLTSYAGWSNGPGNYTAASFNGLINAAGTSITWNSNTEWAFDGPWSVSGNTMTGTVKTCLTCSNIAVYTFTLTKQ